MISRRIRIALLVALMMATVAGAGLASHSAALHRQPMPCGPDCPP